jgi:hypothetical protein
MAVCEIGFDHGLLDCTLVSHANTLSIPRGDLNSGDFGSGSRGLLRFDLLACRVWFRNISMFSARGQGYVLVKLSAGLNDRRSFICGLCRFVVTKKERDLRASFGGLVCGIGSRHERIS